MSRFTRSRSRPDATETQTDDPSQSIERTVAPGGQEQFDMILNVDADRSASASQSALDHVKLTVGCSDEAISSSKPAAIR